MNKNAVNEPEDRPQELVSHIAELRTRFIRALIYVGLTSTIGWVFYGQIFAFLSSPIRPYLEQTSSKFLLTGITEGLLFKMQVSVVAGVILALPALIVEGWLFIRPALTKSERRAVWLVTPLSIVLFIGGVGSAYVVLPVGIGWMIAQNPPGAVFMPSVSQSMLFIVKMLLAFGLLFQLPVVLVFLASVGLVDTALMKRYWKHAVVVISVLAAVGTPSSDALSMLMMFLPMLGLYLLSFALVGVVARRRRRQKS